MAEIPAVALFYLNVVGYEEGNSASQLIQLMRFYLNVVGYEDIMKLALIELHT